MKDETIVDISFCGSCPGEIIVASCQYEFAFPLTFLSKCLKCKCCFEQMFWNVNVFLANVLKCKWNASSFEVFFEQRRGRLSKSGKGVHLIFKLWTLLPQIPAIQLEDNFVLNLLS